MAFSVERVSRRGILRGALGLGALALLAACDTSAPSSGAKPAATSAPAATTAPAAAAATSPAAAATTAPAATSAPAGATPAAKPAAAGNFSGKLTAWGIVSFTKDGDALLGQQMADWGKANKVDAEYVPLPGSDYDAKLSAAVESGAIPDVPMMSGQTQYYVAQNRLTDLSDIFGQIKGFGG